MMSECEEDMKLNMSHIARETESALGITFNKGRIYSALAILDVSWWNLLSTTEHICPYEVKQQILNATSLKRLQYRIQQFPTH